MSPEVEARLKQIEEIQSRSVAMCTEILNGMRDMVASMEKALEGSDGVGDDE